MTKYQRLAALLIKKTEEGTASWEPTSREGVFALSLPDYSVWISMVRGEDQDQQDVLFQIVNSGGAVIDRIRDVDIVDDHIADKPGFFKAIERLYEDARRQAFGVDKALDKLLEELGKPSG